MRYCPRCNHETDVHPTYMGRRYCSSCFWGSESGGEAPEPPPSPLALALLWAGAALVVLGPFFAIQHFFPGLLEGHVHHFWIGMGVYLLCANAFDPGYDPHNVGWCGGLIDNPFSWEDDYNRGMRDMAFFLLPGKVLGAALRGTWRAVRLAV